MKELIYAEPDMRRTMFKSKIHRATVTSTNVDYEGSLTVDSDLLEAADILPYEQIHVWDVTNGARLTTYALPGPAGSGVMQVNGGGAHHVKAGDLVIVATFTTLPTKRAKRFRPTVVFVDAKNRVRDQDESPALAVPAPETVVVDSAPPAKKASKKK